MLRKSLSLLVFVALLSTGCASVNRSNQTTPNPVKSPIVQNTPQAETVRFTTPSSTTKRTLTDYMGFKAGRHWVYTGTGNEFASYTEDVIAMKGTFYQLEQKNGGVVLTRVFDLRKDGLYEVYVQPDTTGKSILGNLPASRLHKDGAKVLPYPIRKGTRWTLPDGSKAQVISTGITRTVPFGKLKNVVHIRVNTTTQTSPGSTQKVVGDVYYAKGIGMIERRFKVGTDVVTSKLQKMTLISK